MNSLSPLIEGEGREFSDVSAGLPLTGQPLFYLWAELPSLFQLCVKGGTLAPASWGISALMWNNQQSSFIILNSMGRI
jgi:hypothetical protein